MGATKTDTYSPEILEFANMAKALGHPARVAIIEFLANTNTCITNDFLDVLPLSQPTVSQHLRELRTVGFIKGEVEGASVCYCLHRENLEKLLRYCNGIKEKMTQNNCC